MNNVERARRIARKKDAEMRIHGKMLEVLDILKDYDSKTEYLAITWFANGAVKSDSGEPLPESISVHTRGKREMILNAYFSRKADHSWKFRSRDREENPC